MTTAAAAAANESAISAACEDFYAREEPKGHCHCLGPNDNATASIAAAMASQRPSLTIHTQDRGGTSGLALLLRGGAYRGSMDNSAAERESAQLRCVQSAMRRLVQPLVDDGVRVRVFMTVYDNLNATALALLREPFGKHLATITTIAARESEQLTMTANALASFLAHCEEQREAFDAVLLTRLDLSFKMDVRALLGPPSQLRGIRFLWQELEAGTKWRFLWPAAYLGAFSSRLSSSDIAHLNLTLARQKRERSLVLTPPYWRSTHRTADTLHAFSFRLCRCFYRAVRMEMTRGWAATPRPASPEVPMHVVAWRPTPVTNHWLHKMQYHLWRAVQGHMGVLVPNGTFDSNPCSTTCMLNPVYDILPRMDWVVRSGICQSPDEFVYDPISQTLCCPSPDYCCPNSVLSCSDPNAILFDAAAAGAGRGVPRETIESGWRRHYLQRSGLMPKPNWSAPIPGTQWRRAISDAASRLAETACPSSEWSDGETGRTGCLFAMTEPSVQLVRDVWLHAPEWTTAWPVNDDESTTKSQATQALREASTPVGRRLRSDA